MDYLINKILLRLEENIKKSDIAMYYFGQPFALPEADLSRGVIAAIPVSTNTIPITTGIDDQDTFNVQVIIARSMKNDAYRNAQKESGAKFLTRVAEGRDDCGNLLPDTVKYVLRKYQREFGLQQPSINIAYDTDEIENLGTVSATIDLIQIQHISQPIV